MTPHDKNLLIVTAIFPPVATSGIHRLVRLARYLTELDVKVSVLTVDETSIAKDFKYDHGILDKLPKEVEIFRVPAFQGLKKLIDIKNKNGNGKPAKRSSSADPKKKAASKNKNRKKGIVQSLKDAVTLNLNTPDNYAFWIYPAVREGIELVESKGIRNILSSSPPGSSHVVSYYIKKQTGVNWIADFRDPWSRKQWFNPEMTGFKRKAIRRLEVKTILGADRVIMNTPELLEDYETYYGKLLTSKSNVIPNGFDPADFEGLDSSPNRDQKKIVISHVGTFYRHRSPLPLIKALGTAVQADQISKNRFQFDLIGGAGKFEAELQSLLEKFGIKNAVRIIPPVPHQEAIQKMFESDVLLLVQPGTKIQVPAKIYEYMATGKPILAVSTEGATSNLVKNHNLGWCADPEDLDEIRRRLVQIDQFFQKKNAKWSVDQQTIDLFNGKKLVNRIFEIL